MQVPYENGGYPLSQGGELPDDGEVVSRGED
jgi:hypothetical protein